MDGNKTSGSPPPNYDDTVDVASDGDDAQDAHLLQPDTARDVDDQGTHSSRNGSSERVPRVNSQGQSVVDDRYYDGKWWRKSSYAKLKALDSKPGSPETG